MCISEGRIIMFVLSCGGSGRAARGDVQQQVAPARFDEVNLTPLDRVEGGDNYFWDEGF